MNRRPMLSKALTALLTSLLLWNGSASFAAATEVELCPTSAEISPYLGGNPYQVPAPGTPKTDTTYGVDCLNPLEVTAGLGNTMDLTFHFEGADVSADCATLSEFAVQTNGKPLNGGFVITMYNNVSNTRIRTSDDNYASIQNYGQSAGQLTMSTFISQEDQPAFDQTLAYTYTTTFDMTDTTLEDIENGDVSVLVQTIGGAGGLNETLNWAKAVVTVDDAACGASNSSGGGNDLAETGVDASGIALAGAALAAAGVAIAIRRRRNARV